MRKSVSALRTSIAAASLVIFSTAAIAQNDPDPEFCNQYANETCFNLYGQVSVECYDYWFMRCMSGIGMSDARLDIAKLD